MCRRNQLIRVALIGLGAGLLVGCQVESVFWCSIFGVAAIVAGVCMKQGTKV